MAINDILEVKFEYAGPEGERCYNILHYLQSSGVNDVTPLNANGVAGSMEALVEPPVMGPVSLGAKWGQLELKVLQGVHVGAYGVSAALGGSTGGSLGPDGPIERCIVYRKHSGLTGRARRGRVFSMMPSDGTFDRDGNFVPSCVDAGFVETLRLFLANDLDLITLWSMYFTPIIFHRSTLTWTAQTDVSVSSLVGVQRRRRIGIGR